MDTSLHFREKIPTPSTRIQMQATLPGNLDKLLVQPHPQGSGSTIKRNHKLPAYRKGWNKHSNLNKMKKQKNIQQVKEHDKSSLNQTIKRGDKESLKKNSE